MILERIRNYIINRYSVYFFKKIDIIFALIISIFSFCLYLYTITPSVSSGDNGELATAVHYLGIAHAPGYPLLSFLGKIFTFIPFESIVYRITVFSAFCGSLSVFFSFLVFLKLLMNMKTLHAYALVASFFASMSYSLSKTLWSQSIIVEVYTIASIFYPLFFLILLYWVEHLIQSHKKKNIDLGDRYLMVYGFIFGISTAAHLNVLMTQLLGIFTIFSILVLFVFSKRKLTKEQFNTGLWYMIFSFTFLFIAYYKFYTKVISLNVSVFNITSLKEGVFWFIIPHILFFSFYAYDHWINPKKIDTKNGLQLFYYTQVKALSMFYLGYFSHFYSFIRSHGNPPINWGGISEATTFFEKIAKFLNLIWRKQYGDQGKLPFNMGNFQDQLYVNLFQHNGSQYTGILYGVMFLGLVYFFRKNIFLALIPTVALITFNLQMILFLSIDRYSMFPIVVDVFHLFSYFTLSIFIAGGILFILTALEKIFSKGKVPIS